MFSEVRDRVSEPILSVVAELLVYKTRSATLYFVQPGLSIYWSLAIRPNTAGLCSSVVQSSFPSIYTQTVLLTTRIDVQIAVDCIQLFNVHVKDKPHSPHAVLITGLLQMLVPLGLKSARDVRTKVRRDRRLVLVKPVLNTTYNILTSNYSVTVTLADNEIYMYALSNTESVQTFCHTVDDIGGQIL